MEAKRAWHSQRRPGCRCSGGWPWSRPSRRRGRDQWRAALHSGTQGLLARLSWHLTRLTPVDSQAHSDAICREWQVSARRNRDSSGQILRLTSHTRGGGLCVGSLHACKWVAAARLFLAAARAGSLTLAFKEEPYR